MSPLLVHFLRRVAGFALVLALLAAAGPPVLRELGLVGPQAPELIAAAERSIEAARHYGADDTLAPFQEATRSIVAARNFLQEGHRRQARRAATAASAQAIVAQRQALARREQQRRRATVIADEIDKVLNGLEDLYTRTSPGLDKAAAASQLSRLKAARQTGAALILAFEQDNYERVIADEAATRQALEAAREEMKAAGAAASPRR